MSKITSLGSHVCPAFMCIRVLVSNANTWFYGFSTSQCWPLDIFSPSHHELFKKKFNLIHLSFSEIGLCAFPWKCQAMVPLCIHYHVSSLKPRAADCSFNVDWLKGRSDVLSGLLVWFCHGTDRKHPEPVKYLVYKIRMWCWYPWFHLTVDQIFFHMRDWRIDSYFSVGYSNCLWSVQRVY